MPEGYNISQQVTGERSPSMGAKKVAIPSRVFMSLEEIQAEPGFKPDAPVKQSTYSHILGAYEFPDRIMSCCHERESTNLCQQLHGYGVVTVDKDGVVSVIGNCCARKYFGADTNLRRDMAKANNERNRLRRLESVRKLVAERDVRLTNIESLARRADVAEERLERFMEPFGPDMRRNLQTMQRDGTNDIAVISVHKRVGLDEDGEVITETDRLHRNVGAVRGLGALKLARKKNIVLNHQALVNVYEKLADVRDDIPSNTLKSLQNSLGVYDDLIIDYQGVIKDCAAFITNDLGPFVFLTSTFAERKNLAKYFLDQQGLAHGNDPAKAFIRDMEGALMDQHKADRIEIAY